ncbi:MAG TPA: CpaD family pilus assembly lipoprotein [Alphaproteobacteria bacterium]|nr:CpaD family pilus assembly lipoprotein [Alphaproteobacteria bacterium]
MRASSKPRLLAPVLVTAVLLLGAACTPDTARWSTVETPKENKVELVKLTHAVHFAPGSSVPEAGEEQRLAAFLAQIQVDYGDQITFDTGPSHGNPAADRLAARRAAAVAALLRRRQVQASPAAQPTVEGALARDAVVVTVGRYVVTPPVCPDWRKPEADDYTNTPTSNYGCATATDLGMMVANPGDLVNGTPISPGDADFAARGIERYRSGEISKSIKPELPKLYSGGNGQ